MAINPVTTIGQVASNSSVTGLTKGNGIENFKDVFRKALDDVNKLQLDSDQLTTEFATGQNDNIHQVMIAAEKASIALQFTMQIRTKILDAYNEIMRMQL